MERWLTDYYEFRFEDQNQNKKFFYQWDGAGLRYEIQEFISCIYNHRFSTARLRRRESIAIAYIMQQFAFEGKEFYAIANYDAFLKKRYGDYMQLPPEEERVPGHAAPVYWKEDC